MKADDNVMRWLILGITGLVVGFGISCGGGGGGGGGGTTSSSNNAPVSTSMGGTSAKEYVAFSYDVNATDEDGDTLTYSLTTAPSGMTIDPSSGAIAWTPVSFQLGDNSVVISVSDGTDAVTQSYTIAVQTDLLSDGAIDGPAVGTSPNDSDNTFRSLVAHPTDPNAVLIGNEGNGIFKSTDGGATWSRINIGLYYGNSINAYPEIYQMIFDASDSNKIYAATTGGPRPTTVSGASGFYYTTDEGATWTRSIEGLHNYAVTSVVQDTTNTDILYIGMDNAITSDGTETPNSGPNMYKSVDGGLTWTGLTLPVTNNRITNIVIDPTDSNIIYCAGFDEYETERLSSNHLGFARSNDGGATWTQINTGLVSLSIGFIAIDPNSPSTLYCFVSSDSGAIAYKSTDSGDNWTRFQTEGVARNISKLKVSPFDSNTIIGATHQYVYTTTDGGSTWSEALDFSGAGIIFKEIEYTSDANIIYGSADQLKVYESTDGGTTFSPVSGDIQTLIGH